jgi:hypothetical protein
MGHNKSLNTIIEQGNLTMLSKRTMPRNNWFFFCAFLCILSFTVVVVQSSRNLTQLWMKVGTYAEYKFQSTGPIFLNMTLFNINATATFRWECVDLNETLAKLSLSITFAGEPQDIHFSTELYVNIITREVILRNGTLIGKTRLWAPAFPEEKETVFLWDIPPDRVVGKVSNLRGTQGTPQGYQQVFMVEGNGTFMGRLTSFIMFYDLDTGVMTSGILWYEATLLPFEIAHPGTMGTINFTDTNIDLGPPELWPEIATFLMIIAPIAVFLVIFIFVYRHRKRKSLTGT